MKIPKFPKGLKASVNRLKRKDEQRKKVAARKAEIKRLQAERERLRKKLY
jgi:hypothetical protein